MEKSDTNEIQHVASREKEYQSIQGTQAPQSSHPVIEERYRLAAYIAKDLMASVGNMLVLPTGDSKAPTGVAAIAYSTAQLITVPTGTLFKLVLKPTLVMVLWCFPFCRSVDAW